MATDPVCGMEVREGDAPAKSEWQGKTWYFCSDECKRRFEADPKKYAIPAA